MIFFSVHFDNERLFGILLNFASNASFVLQTKYEVPLPVQCGFTNGDDFFFESGWSAGKRENIIYYISWRKKYQQKKNKSHKWRKRWEETAIEIEEVEKIFLSILL